MVWIDMNLVLQARVCRSSQGSSPALLYLETSCNGRPFFSNVARSLTQSELTPM